MTYWIGYNASYCIESDSKEEALKKFEEEIDYSEIEFIVCEEDESQNEDFK